MFRFLLIIITILSISTARAYAEETHEHWVAYYGDKLPAEKFLGFDVIVFDSDSHPPLAPLQSSPRILLGYLSIGEAESYRSYYRILRQKKLLMAKNPLWKGHRIIDIRKPEWATYINNVLIPAILAQGFNGVMLDTLDSPISLENRYPKRYPGMKTAALNLIKSIRARYPTIHIMVNRAFPILPQVSDQIDMVMAETICTDWQPGKKKPVILPVKDYNDSVILLKNLQKKSPSLKVYTLDYWPPADKKGIKHIYDMQRQSGFIPYVSTLNLQTVYPEP